MKEATGELNMTLITVIAIAAIAAIFYTIVWPLIKQNIQTNTYCASAYNCGACSGGNTTCYYTDANGAKQSVKCKC